MAVKQHNQRELKEFLKIGAFEEHSDDNYVNPYSGKNEFFEDATGLDTSVFDEFNIEYNKNPYT
jgi:hypothetical protein